MDNADIRWKQRFQNLEKAFNQLTFAVSLSEPTAIERAGIIQIYEFTFELAWKTIKDFLEENKAIAKFPKDTIKQGFKYELIADGDLWMDMLDKRNLMAHTYDEEIAKMAYLLISDKYYQAIKDLYEKLKTEI